MDLRTTPCGLGAANAAQQSDWTIFFLPHLWVRGYTTRRYHVEISKSRSLSKGEADEARQHELDTVEEARINALKHPANIFQRRRSSSTTNSR